VIILKAYDTVKWSFLLDLLSKLGFPPRFIGWIRECLTSPKFLVNINGELVGFFGNTRGLRQGDLLSSYLFVIIMEAFSMLVQKRIEDSLKLFVYHWRCGRTKLTHMCFVDVLMMFFGNSISNVKTLFQALQDFSNLSELTPNNRKSSIYVAGQSFRNVVLNTFGFTEGKFIVKYSGVPLITSKLSISDCKPLVDSITSRIKSWIAKFLSFAGRLQLIQAVLYSIQSYWNGLFILPK